MTIHTSTLTMDQMQARIAQLEAANAAMKAASQRKLTLKVSDKGAVSLYGLGRFPVTLYKGQWERLIGEIEHVKAFITINAGLLAVKGE